MSLRYRSLGGGNRAWTIDTWADFASLPTANVLEGDTLYYVAGKVSMTRRASRWRPDEADLWGRNDATVPPLMNGSIDSEGVWTCSTNPSGHLPPRNIWFDVLAVILPDRAAFEMNVWGPTGAPSFAGIRAVVMTSVNASMSLSCRQNDSIYGGASVSYGGTVNDVIYYGQGIVVPGGSGGFGDDTTPGSAGESIWRPALTDYNLTPYDIAESAQGPITIWGGTEHESRSI